VNLFDVPHDTTLTVTPQHPSARWMLLVDLTHRQCLTQVASLLSDVLKHTKWRGAKHQYKILFSGCWGKMCVYIGSLGALWAMRVLGVRKEWYVFDVFIVINSWICFTRNGVFVNSFS
jgi:hypothetical protein